MVNVTQWLESTGTSEHSNSFGLEITRCTGRVLFEAGRCGHWLSGQSRGSVWSCNHHHTIISVTRDIRGPWTNTQKLFVFVCFVRQGQYPD